MTVPLISNRLAMSPSLELRRKLEVPIIMLGQGSRTEEYANFLLGGYKPDWLEEYLQFIGSEVCRYRYRGALPNSIDWDARTAPFGIIVFENPNYPDDWPNPDKGIEEVPA